MNGRFEACYRDVISGRAGGLASIARLILHVAAGFYGVAVGIRNFACRNGYLRCVRAPLLVVSLGNLTTGGTGKTPFAAFVAMWFKDRGARVCILSRGYGARAGAANDEALVLEQLCPDVPQLQNPDRVASARRAQEELGSQILLLDDGFQHRRLARDLDIALIDASNPWGYGYLLPRGLLREPVGSLARASLVVITRVDQVQPDEIEAIRRRIASVHPECEVVEVAFPAELLINAAGDSAGLETLRDQPVAAFCGIGNADAFRDSLTRTGMRVAAFLPFPDHHSYSPAEIEQLQRWAAAQNAVAVVTTQKDLVKIRLDRLGDRPLWAVQIGTRIINGGELLERQLQALMTNVEIRMTNQ